MARVCIKMQSAKQKVKRRILGSFGTVLHASLFLDLGYFTNSCCVRKLPFSVAHTLATNATPVDFSPRCCVKPSQSSRLLTRSHWQGMTFRGIAATSRLCGGSRCSQGNTSIAGRFSEDASNEALLCWEKSRHGSPSESYSTHPIHRFAWPKPPRSSRGKFATFSVSHQPSVGIQSVIVRSSCWA